MKPTSLLVVAMIGAALSAEATEFGHATLLNGGTQLVFSMADGSAYSAPKLEDQDSFAVPGVSSNHRYAGWLALYPNQGASYSQPLGLTIVDASMHMHRFSGDFGMVWNWCFAKKDDAVIYRFALSHGQTAVGFHMRRIVDGKLLRNFRLKPLGPDGDEYQAIWAQAPAWTRCAQGRATLQ